MGNLGGIGWRQGRTYETNQRDLRSRRPGTWNDHFGTMNLKFIRSSELRWIRGAPLSPSNWAPFAPISQIAKYIIFWGNLPERQSNHTLNFKIILSLSNKSDSRVLNCLMYWCEVRKKREALWVFGILQNKETRLS